MMIKTYIKTATIKAEQFDGSVEMIDKYDIINTQLASTAMGFEGAYFLPTLEGELRVNIGDWIASGVNGEHWAIKNDVFKKTYADLPVIPKNVANYLTDCKRANTTIGTSLSGNIVLFGHARSHDMIHDILSWLCPSDNQDLFARAWLDGYQVEEDK
jgi:hypothetical protein